MRYSKRGQLLSCFSEIIKTSELAVEIYMKWYTLFLVMPDEQIVPIVFPDEHDLEKHDDLETPSAMDHVPNPAFVERYCKEQGYYISEITRELLVGRWIIDVKEKYFNEI